MTEDEGGSPPCFLGEAETTRREVMRWRKAERARLIAARQAMAVADRQAAEARIRAGLDGETGRVIGIYWPFKGEPDLRTWARGQGAEVALPVVVDKGRPLEFRLWQPGAALVRGVWDIPVPAEGAAVVRPDLVIAAVVGVDPQGFRLGYGGGFYDRTLAALRAAGAGPRVIGVGFAFQAIATIFPFDHDIPMDRVILG